MIKIIFNNLEKSEFTREFTLERIRTIAERFPDLNDHKISATLSMENSPTQAGPDVFTVKLFITGKRYRSVMIEKSGQTFFSALAEVIEHALERLNRYGDKERVRRRNQLRKLDSAFRLPLIGDESLE